MSPPLRNVLLITADQWRGDCLSTVGHPLLRTPSLDQLAAEGTLFRRHYANAAPCGPSRACLHTGLYLQNHRSVTNGTPLDARHTNWALEARRLGYDPVLFGYTDTSLDPRALAADDPRLRSYEGVLPGLTPRVELTTYPETWARWLAERGYPRPEHPYHFYFMRADGLEWEDGGPHPRPLALPAEHHDTAFLCDHVLDYLDECGDRPWIVHLSWLRPHPPWIAPAPYHRLYPPDELPERLRAADPDSESAQHPWLAWYLSDPERRAPEERKRRRLEASYLGLMREVDDQLGRLLEALRTRDLDPHTLVVFTSDHGEQLGDHWMLGKAGYFEQSFHIPLIVRDPRPEADTARGRCIDAFTESVDVAPTVLEWLRAPVPPHWDGRPLQPILETGRVPEDWRREAHWEYDFRDVVFQKAERGLGLSSRLCNLAVLRGEREKYVHFAGLPPLYFDLEDDPGELRDRSRDPACRARMLDAVQRMLSWRMHHDEQTLTHLALTASGVVGATGGR